MASDIDLFAEKVRIFRKTRTKSKQAFPNEMRIEAIALRDKYGAALMKEMCGLGAGMCAAWEKTLKAEVSRKAVTKSESVRLEAASQQANLTHTRFLLQDAIAATKEAVATSEVKPKPSCVLLLRDLRVEIYDADFLARALIKFYRETEGGV